MIVQREAQPEGLMSHDRRPISQYELARMVVEVLQDLIGAQHTFSAHDVTAEVRRRHPDCEIRYYDQTWDGTPAPWYPGEPYRRGHVADRGVQSLVHELMQVHCADEYRYRTTRPSRKAEQDLGRYIPLHRKRDRLGDAA